MKKILLGGLVVLLISSCLYERFYKNSYITIEGVKVYSKFNEDEYFTLLLKKALKKDSKSMREFVEFGLSNTQVSSFRNYVKYCISLYQLVDVVGEEFMNKSIKNISKNDKGRVELNLLVGKKYVNKCYLPD